MTNNQRIRGILKQATFYSDDVIYTLLKLPPHAAAQGIACLNQFNSAFCVFIADKDEISLVLPSDVLADMPLDDAEIGETYRLLTVDVVLEPDLIGFMAVVSGALADANVGVFPYAAYTRDHILVPAHQFDTALHTLQTLQKNASEQ